MGQLIHEALSEEIIGAAMAVLNELKPGLDENLYKNALVIEFSSTRNCNGNGLWDEYPRHPYYCPSECCFSKKIFTTDEHGLTRIQAGREKAPHF